MPPSKNVGITGSLSRSCVIATDDKLASRSYMYLLPTCMGRSSYRINSLPLTFDIDIDIHRVVVVVRPLHTCIYSICIRKLVSLPFQIIKYHLITPTNCRARRAQLQGCSMRPLSSLSHEASRGRFAVHSSRSRETSATKRSFSYPSGVRAWPVTSFSASLHRSKSSLRPGRLTVANSPGLTAV